MIKKILSLLFSFLIIISFTAASRPVIPKLPAEAKERRIGSVQAVMINTFDNYDFPIKTNLYNKELSQQIKNTIVYLDKIGINTIFYEAYNYCEAMYNSKYSPVSDNLRTENKLSVSVDPLKLLIDEALKYNIDVYAVISPYNVGKTGKIENNTQKTLVDDANIFTYEDNIYFYPNDAVNTHIANISLELAKKYNLSGIIYNGLDSPAFAQVSDYTQKVSEAFAKIKESIQTASHENFAVGVSINGSNDDLSNSLNISSALLEKLMVDIIMPKINQTVENGYEDTVALWNSYAGKYGASLITINNAFKILNPNNDNVANDKFELNYQAIINENLGADGIAIDSLTILADKFFEYGNTVSSLFVSNVKSNNEDFLLSNALRINAPITGIIYTTNNSYYVTGTSDPTQPLYINDTPYNNRANNGVFGVNLNLNEDSNRFKFSQGERSIHIEIIKREIPVTPKKIISSIENHTTYPQYSEFIDASGKINVKCVAPSGSTVTATLDSMSVTLDQTNPNIKAGYPATFKGVISAPDKYSNETVTDIGKILYAMTNNGKINVSKSPGNILIVGANAQRTIQIDDYYTPVYKNSDGTQPFSIMKIGAKEYVTEETDGYYKIKSGGYIPKTSAYLISGSAKVESTYSTYVIENDDDGEKITLIGTNSPNIQSNMTDNSVIFTFYNTTAIPDIVLPKTNLFKNIMKVKISDNSYQVHFIFKDDVTLRGYDYRYTGDNYKDTELYFSYVTKINAEIGKPLKDISVLLDPGNGGDDTGVFTVAGIFGPTEADINLAIALKTKELLESMGATVQLTRYEDLFYSDFDRMRVGEQMKPDYFISINQNSVGEGKNGEEQSGTNTLYSDERYKEFANLLASNVASTTGRNNLKGSYEQSKITKMTYCPSVILNCGYLSNPTEYGQLIDQMQIYKTACGIVKTIMEYTSNYIDWN